MVHAHASCSNQLLKADLDSAFLICLWIHTALDKVSCFAIVRHAMIIMLGA